MCCSPIAIPGPDTPIFALLQITWPAAALITIKMAAEGSSATEQKRNVLIGVTGSVASVKLSKLVDELLLLQQQPNIQVIATDCSTHFFDEDKIPVKVFRDKDEWEAWSSMKDPVLHIELRRWADLMVIAPLDANTMAKVANGLCDNLLTCTVRAWDMKKPLLFCPAMNTFMWEHPITSEQVERLVNIGYIHVPPIKKTLACGDTGVGAMAEVTTIVALVKENLDKMT